MDSNRKYANYQEKKNVENKTNYIKKLRKMIKDYIKYKIVKKSQKIKLK